MTLGTRVKSFPDFSVIRNQVNRWSMAPGLIVVLSLAALIYFLQTRPGLGGFSKASLAILLGAIVANTVRLPKACRPGIKFCLKKVLNVAIILLGFRLSIDEIFSVGILGFLIVLAALISTFMFTHWLGRRLGLNPQFIQLIAAGTSICGSSAIMATNGVVKATEEDVTRAIATVTALGTVAMIIYPFLPDLLDLSPQNFGLWCGFSIHQTAQVVATGFQHGSVSGEFATISKLSRVMFLIPTIITMGFLTTQQVACRSKSGEGGESGEGDRASFSLQRLPIPWFILCFLAVVMVNSLGIVPQEPRSYLITLDGILFTLAMVAVGLETKWTNLRAAGLKPFYLGTAAWGHLSITTLILIKLWL